ncbi:hypothetical protein SS50377_25204 [Spironucleus salmonicida]|uniref:Uncharacterized protein n=1 Tax=Spironucleus salmonicida TaxID=348837 RepID=V6LT40_9EUKA|nr:hypothetical protein SS50377_25204 [Spironucleus salmonicida]|eukprot:EST46861.1 Hypothetical protein SS50377_13126 [Spironucleus salmonicida]
MVESISRHNCDEDNISRLQTPILKNANVKFTHNPASQIEQLKSKNHTRGRLGNASWLCSAKSTQFQHKCCKVPSLRHKILTHWPKLVPVAHPIKMPAPAFSQQDDSVFKIWIDSNVRQVHKTADMNHQAAPGFPSYSRDARDSRWDQFYHDHNGAQYQVPANITNGYLI